MDSDDDFVDDLDELEPDIEEIDEDDINGIEEVESSDEEEQNSDEELDELEELMSRPNVFQQAGQTDAKYNQVTTTAIYVPDDERETSNVLSVTELAGVIAIRAAQISKDGQYYVDLEGEYKPEAIARKEVYERRCLLKVSRLVGQTSKTSTYELWDVNEMILPNIGTTDELGFS
jgi:DNA-directed RNA polymerase subunit K/omega